jgi:peptide/nickel transport system substrate-binding protein
MVTIFLVASKKPITLMPNIHILILGLACCLMVMSGCSKPNKEIIKFGLASAPITLDPRYATDAASSRINRLFYEQLVGFDSSMSPVPQLADWKMLSPVHYRFRLLNNKKRFHNGMKLSAEDVKATYEFILREDNVSPHRALLSVIQRIVSPDPTHIDFFLNKPDPLFPGYLVIGIIPAPLIATRHPFNRHAIGSGVFKWVAWTHQGNLQLSRMNDNQLIEFVTIPDSTVRVLKLLNGEIDMLQNDLSPELVGFLKQQSGFNVSESRGSNFTYLGFNLRDPVVGRYKVRRAIAHAIDRSAIIKYLFRGTAQTANSVLPPDHWAGISTFTPYAYDQKTARDLLASLGYSKHNPLEISYKTSVDSFRLRIATIIQSQLAEVGIKVTIKSYDWGSFYGDIKAGKFQMYSLSWVGIKSPDIFRTIFHSKSIPPHGANRGRFSDPELDDLLDKVQTEPEKIIQKVYYHKIQQRIIATLPYVPLWFEQHVFTTTDVMKGFSLNLEGNYDGLMTVSRLH